MPMSARLLRPRSTGFHPEAQDWRNRVIANGGTVSGSTLTAVSNFCRSIDAASGLRAAILRANLFCGNDLNACLVPLYRAASRTASVLGNTTDTNFNFVSGDFQETGSGGGLVGNGSSKYLDTGLAPSVLSSLTSVHLSYSGTSLETSGDRIAIGAYGGTGAAAPDLYSADVYAGYLSARAVRLGNAGSVGATTIATPGTTESHFIGTRTAAAASAIYRGGTLATSSTTSASPTSTTRPFFVFALNQSPSPAAYTAARMRMYSIGNGLTAAQALAFSNAVIALNTALGRA